MVSTSVFGEMFVHHLDNLVMRNAEPMGRGGAKLRRWRQAFPGVQIVDAGDELIKGELAGVVGVMAAVGHHDRGSSIEPKTSSNSPGLVDDGGASAEDAAAA